MYIREAQFFDTFVLVVKKQLVVFFA